MKKASIQIFVLLLLLFVSGGALSSLSAQEKRPRNLPAYDQKVLRFGFTIGLNMMDMGLKRNYDAAGFVYADVNPNFPNNMGFQVNAIGDLRLSKNLHLVFTPGINLNSMQVYFYEYRNDGTTVELGDLMDVGGISNPAQLGPAYLDFPLMFRYRSLRTNNIRPYLVSGLALRYNLAGKKSGHFRVDKESNEINPIRFNRAEVFYEIGFGVDNYSQYFKFAPEIRFAVGLFNIADPQGYEVVPNWAESISSARSFIVMLNFHFQ